MLSPDGVAAGLLVDDVASADAEATLLLELLVDALPSALDGCAVGCTVGTLPERAIPSPITTPATTMDAATKMMPNLEKRASCFSWRSRCSHRGPGG